ncbi:MAG TPA: response regulator [Myxococcota bacterium]|nr:response regulator [Myxococcota bacterium]
MANKLVLVVEDRPMNAKLLRDVLVASGYEVVEAEDAERGLAIARERLPALVLMDIQLPGMDGVAAVGELKRDARTAKIPVIAVTASAMPLERESILRAGFDGYQAKPISVKELLAEVRRFVSVEG